MKPQCFNHRNNGQHAFQYEGAHRSIREIARMVGMKPSTLHFRLITKGMSVADAISLPITPKNKLHLWGTKPARLYEFRGQMLSVYDIAPILGIHPETVRRRAIGDRIAEGKDLEDPRKEPPANAVIVTFRGQTLTVAEWARRTGIDRFTIYARLYQGWPVKRALTEPPMRGDQRNLYRANRRTITRMTASFRALARRKPELPPGCDLYAPKLLGNQPLVQKGLGLIGTHIDNLTPPNTCKDFFLSRREPLSVHPVHRSAPDCFSRESTSHQATCEGPPGGYDQTFTGDRLTGGGSVPRDLQELQHNNSSKGGRHANPHG